MEAGENLEDSQSESYFLEHQLFEENKKKDYLYLVKFNNTAYCHCVWIDYQKAKELNSSKLSNFCKRMVEYANNAKEYETKFKDPISNSKPANQKQATSNQKFIHFNSNYLICERILGCKIYKDQITKYFVKWKDLNYNN